VRINKGEVKRLNFEQYQDFLNRILLAQKEVEGKGILTYDLLDDELDSDFRMAKTVTFQVTDSCNLQCTYCYQINKGKRVMSFETAKNFFDMLVADSYNKDKYTYLGTTPGIVVEFIGGEPLLEIDLIDQICDYIRYKLISENHPWANKYTISMISNGVEYFNPKVQDFIKKNKGRLSFGISLDGCKDLHDMCRVFPDGLGSYELAEAGCIHYKKNHDDKMLTKMTICPENLSWTYEAFKNLYNLDYPIIHANCVYEKGWNINHATLLYHELKKIADFILEQDKENVLDFTMFDDSYCRPLDDSDNQNYCGSTGCMLCCDPDGNIAPCIRFLKSSLGEELGDFTIGHVRSGMGVEEQDKANIELLDSITRRSQSTDECWNCPIAAGCGWCTAYNYQETGSPDKRCTYICCMHKARSLANVYYWNKVYKKNNEHRYFEMYLPKEEALKIITESEYNILLELIENNKND
jgi:radical SAM peptide maturase (CXXX-repeat target family)